jgi:hypothetical protein
MGEKQFHTKYLLGSLKRRGNFGCTKIGLGKEVGGMGEGWKCSGEIW